MMNLLASLAILHALGRSVLIPFEKWDPLRGLMGEWKNRERTGFKVVVDYAHTPDALRMPWGCYRGRTEIFMWCSGAEGIEIREKGLR